MNAKTSKIQISYVKSNGKTIKTWDNPLNRWVRDLKTGKLVPVDRK
jgi:hypothetical protein